MTSQERDAAMRQSIKDAIVDDSKLLGLLRALIGFNITWVPTSRLEAMLNVLGVEIPPPADTP